VAGVPRYTAMVKIETAAPGLVSDPGSGAFRQHALASLRAKHIVLPVPHVAMSFLERSPHFHIRLSAKIGSVRSRQHSRALTSRHKRSSCERYDTQVSRFWPRDLAPMTFSAVMSFKRRSIRVFGHTLLRISVLGLTLSA